MEEEAIGQGVHRIDLQGGDEKEDRGRGNGGGKGEEDLGGSTSEHYDFDKWQWWSTLKRGEGSPAARLAAPGGFIWNEKGKEAVEKELLEEGVAVMGMVTEDWMRALEDHCATVPYDTVLSLGCERREDSYKVATGSPLAAPWAEWMLGYEHEFGYASVITAFPVSPDELDQGWHRDTPDDLECEDHQITLMIYITDVRVSNGATQFRRIISKDEVSFPGPRGTVVAFVSSRTEHRGLANREKHPRLLMYVAFDHEGEGNFVEVPKKPEGLSYDNDA